MVFYLGIWGSGQLAWYILSGHLATHYSAGDCSPKAAFRAFVVFAIMQFLARFHLVWDQKNRSTLIFENQKKKIISFRRCLACRNQDFCCHLPLLCTVHKQISNRPKECLLSSHLAISWFGLQQCSNAMLQMQIARKSLQIDHSEVFYLGIGPRASRYGGLWFIFLATHVAQSALWFIFPATHVA